MFHVWFSYVHLARNALKDTQYLWSIEKYSIECTGFLPFSNTPGKSYSIILHDCTLKWKTTSFCWLYSAHSLSYCLIKYSISRIHYFNVLSHAELLCASSFPAWSVHKMVYQKETMMWTWHKKLVFHIALFSQTISNFKFLKLKL